MSEGVDKDFVNDLLLVCMYSPVGHWHELEFVNEPKSSARSQGFYRDIHVEVSPIQ